MKKFLVNANKNMHLPLFFQSLAKTSMLALSSPKSSYGKNNVFMIQIFLPKPEKAQDALEIIQNAFKFDSDRNSYLDKWCSYRDLNPGHVLGKHEY